MTPKELGFTQLVSGGGAIGVGLGVPTGVRINWFAECPTRGLADSDSVAWPILTSEESLRRQGGGGGLQKTSL